MLKHIGLTSCSSGLLTSGQCCCFQCCPESLEKVEGGKELLLHSSVKSQRKFRKIKNVSRLWLNLWPSGTTTVRCLPKSLEIFSGRLEQMMTLMTMKMLPFTWNLKEEEEEDEEEDEKEKKEWQKRKKCPRLDNWLALTATSFPHSYPKQVSLF